MSNPWQEWKRKNLEAQQAGRVGPTALLNPDTPRVSDEEAERRMQICSLCPNLMVTKQCSKCGCFMPAKTTLLYAACPEEKW